MSQDQFQFVGTPITRFRAGWALIPFHGEKVHHWTRIKDRVTQTQPAPDGNGVDVVYFYRSACGLVVSTTRRAPPMDQGNWPRCKNCQKSIGVQETSEARP